MDKSKLFIGPQEVKSVDGCVVTFADDKKEMFTQETLKNVVTPEACDYKNLRDIKCDPIVKEITEIMLKYGPYMSEINFIFDRVIESLNFKSDSVSCKTYGVSDKDKVSVKHIDDMITGNITDIEFLKS